MAWIIEANSASMAYVIAIDKVWTRYTDRPCPRGLVTREIRDAVIVIAKPHSGQIKTGWRERDETMLAYLAKERALFRSRTDSAKEWSEAASKFWAGIANPDGTVNSNYGRLVYMEKTMAGCWTNSKADCDGQNRPHPDEALTPFDWALRSLLMDADTRQATIVVALPRHRWVGNKDQPCTLHIQFSLRDDRLDATTVMRSNDLIKGFPYDVPFFISIQEYMVAMLREGLSIPGEGVKRISEIEIGTYTHIAHSLHLYERDREIVEGILRSSNSGER